MSRLADIFNSALSDRLSPTEQRDISRGFSVLETTVRDLGSSIGASGRGSRISSGSVVFGGDGLKLFNPRTGFKTVSLSPRGNFSTGYDLDRPEYTSLKVLANDQYYNVETLGFGDVLLGDNSPGASNLFWDRSTGRLNFRGGTTVNAYIDTDGTLTATGATISGTITASAGSIGGWTIDTTSIHKSTIVLDSANDKITVGGTDVILDSSGITAIAGTIGGWTLAATSLSAPGVSINSAGTIVLGSSDITLDGANARIDVGSAAGIVIDGGNNRIRSSNYASGVEGWQIKSDGSGEFGNLLVRGEIQSAVFTLNEVAVTGGTQAVVRRAGKLYADFTTPNVSDTIQIANHAGGSTCDFINTDIIRIKTGLSVDSWMTLSAKSQQSEYASFTATHSAGSVLDAIKAGAAIIGYSATTGGSIYLSADDAVGSSANLSIIKHSGSPWSDESLMVRLGNLDGSYGATTEAYGVGLGDYSSGNYLSFNALGTGKFIIAAGDGTVQIDENYISLLDKGGDPPRLTFREASTSTWYTQGRLYGENNATHSTVWLVSRRDTGAPWTSHASTIISAYDSIVGATADVRMTIDSTRIVSFSNVDYLRTDGGLSVGSLVNTPGVGQIIATSNILSIVDGSGGGFYAGASNDVHLYRSAANVWYTPDEFRSNTILWAMGDGSSYGIKIGTDGKIYRDTTDSLYTSNKFTAERFTATLAGSSGGIFIGGDTQIYRNAANELTTPDLFRFGSNIWVTGYGVFSATTSLYLRNQTARINFGTADDVALYRSAANELRTPDALTVDSTLTVSGLFKRLLGGTTYTVGALVMLGSPIKNTTYFEGQSHSTAGKTFIDMSNATTGFGLTNSANITAYVVDVFCRDSGTPSASILGVAIDGQSVGGEGGWLECNTVPSDYITRTRMVVDANSNGDLYIQYYASGTTTLDVWLRVAGYYVG